MVADINKMAPMLHEWRPGNLRKSISHQARHSERSAAAAEAEAKTWGKSYGRRAMMVMMTMLMTMMMMVMMTMTRMVMLAMMVMMVKWECSEADIVYYDSSVKESKQPVFSFRYLVSSIRPCREPGPHTKRSPACGKSKAQYTLDRS